jgi:thiol:disulfide interchange protein DsbD
VAQRTQEIGVRMALGARPFHVLGLIFKQSLVILVIGAVIGLAGAFALTRLMRTLLFEVTATDPLTYMSVIGLLTVLYLSGRIRIGHSSPVRKFSITRIAFIVLFGVITLYLIPGVTNTKWANLKRISGFPPPLCYSIYSDPFNCKRGFKPLENDYAGALAKAKAENKPVLIDFTGWACVNCRKMEENVWIDPAVLKRIKNDFVLVSLYVDESTPLPADKQYESKITGRKVKTIGNKWAEFQASRYNKISQPWYVLLDHNEKELAEGRGYDTDISAYIKWLDNAKGEFKKRTEVKAAP